MKINLKNLGPIREWSCTLDDDLLFIYGKNNIGKSYAISTVYLILKNLAFETPLPFRYLYRYDQIFTTADQIPEEIVGKLQSAEVDITSIVESRYKAFLQLLFLDRFELSMKNSFGAVDNLNNQISHERFKIELIFNSITLIISNDEKKLTIDKVDFHKKIYAKKIQIHRKPKTDAYSITVYYFKDISQFEADINQFIYSLHLASVNEIFEKVRNVYYLPASRSGLYRALNAFSQILAELAKKRTFLQTRIELPNISEPDLDYFTRLNEIRTRRVSEKYLTVARSIEQKLLKGEVLFETSSRRILFKPENMTMKLEILATSSMIAEVSPIVLYLKSIIGSEDDSVRRKTSTESKAMVFIEEPEAHLHPEAQVDLMLVFGDLIAKDVRLVVTSHSNYMFYKLNNLIIAGKINEKKTRCMLLEASDGGSVSKDLSISRVGVDDKNFLNASETLYDEKIQSLETIEKKPTV